MTGLDMPLPLDDRSLGWLRYLHRKPPTTGAATASRTPTGTTEPVIPCFPGTASTWSTPVTPWR